jgi:tetratricopeptide (TPR) repeat protein
MKRYFLLTLLVIGSCFVTAPLSSAQSALLDLPRASQRALVLQRVGITNIAIRYHRPLVNGRKVWSAGIAPYGQVWRAGANENTTIEFGDAVSVEGKPLAKGTYGLHMIPGENEWTVIFSKNASSWGSFSYNQSEDALRVTVKPQPSEMHEALTYDFDDVKPTSTVVTLRWDKVAVPFKVEVATNEIVKQSLQNQLRGRVQYEWQPWDEAASYFLDNKYNYEEALKDADQSIQVEKRFENVMTKARALDALSRKDEATAARKEALSIGSGLQIHVYGRQLQAQGHQDQAFEVFRANMKKYPNEWFTHGEAARIASAEGKFDDAIKEMKLAATTAPDQVKPGIDGLIKRLEAKQDINK